MSMTMAEGRAECKRLFDECATILAKYGGRLTDDMPAEDRQRVANNMAEINGLEQRIGQWQTDATTSDTIADGVVRYGTPAEAHSMPAANRGPFGLRGGSVGRHVTSAAEYRSGVAPGGALTGQRPFLQLDLPGEASLAELSRRAAAGKRARELRALVTSGDASGGAFVVPDRLPGFTELGRSALGLLDVLPTLQTTSDVVEWVRQTTRTNNAAPVAEATATTGTSGLKPESVVAFDLESAPVETIATWIPATTRILADAPMLRSAIDDELLYMIAQTLQAQCITGNGTTPNLLGLENQTGIQTGAAGTDPFSAIFNAALAVQVSGGVAATDALVTQATFAALRLARENAASGTLGGYVLGPPNMPGPMTVFGLELTMIPELSSGVAIVGNFTATTVALVEREGGTISMGWINDQFVRNMVTILAELRALLIVRRPLGLFKLTGMPS